TSPTGFLPIAARLAALADLRGRSGHPCHPAPAVGPLGLGPPRAEGRSHGHAPRTEHNVTVASGYRPVLASLLSRCPRLKCMTGEIEPLVGCASPDGGMPLRDSPRASLSGSLRATGLWGIRGHSPRRAPLVHVREEVGRGARVGSRLGRCIEHGLGQDQNSTLYLDVIFLR